MNPIKTITFPGQTEPHEIFDAFARDQLEIMNTNFTNALDNKFNKTGDFLSGKLIFNSSNSTNSAISFLNEECNYITFPAASQLAFGTDTSNDAITIAISANGLYPYVNNTQTLGTPTQQWNNIYAATFTENGIALNEKYAPLYDYQQIDPGEGSLLDTGKLLIIY